VNESIANVKPDRIPPKSRVPFSNIGRIGGEIRTHPSCNPFLYDTVLEPGEKEIVPFPLTS